MTARTVSSLGDARPDSQRPRTFRCTPERSASWTTVIRRACSSQSTSIATGSITKCAYTAERQKASFVHLARCIDHDPKSHLCRPCGL